MKQHLRSKEQCRRFVVISSMNTGQREQKERPQKPRATKSRVVAVISVRATVGDDQGGQYKILIQSPPSRRSTSVEMRRIREQTNTKGLMAFDTISSGVLRPIQAAKQGWKKNKIKRKQTV